MLGKTFKCTQTNERHNTHIFVVPEEFLISVSNIALHLWLIMNTQLSLVV